MKFVYSILLIVSLFFCGDNKYGISQLSIDVTSEITNPKQYIITKNKERIVIDGIANESGWQRALYSDLFIDIQGIKKPKYDTRMKMLWDEEFLYIYGEMEEPHIWGDLKKRDTFIFHNNAFEVFIAPSGTTRNYAEIEINCLETIWDLLLDKPYRDGGKPDSKWNLDGLKTGIQIKGTLNNYNDIDSLWTVEMAMPMDALLDLKNPSKSLPQEDEQWKVNFLRVEWDYDIENDAYRRKKDKSGQLQSGYHWVWSNQNEINMHAPEKWGIIQFTNDSTSIDKTFIENESLAIEQVCFALYRQMKSKKLNSLLNGNSEKPRLIDVKYSDKDSLKAVFYKTNLGFEFKIDNEKSNQVFTINQDGELHID